MALMIIFFLFVSRLRKVIKHDSLKDINQSLHIVLLGFNIFSKYVVYFGTMSYWGHSRGYQFSLFNAIDFVTVLVMYSLHMRAARENLTIAKVRSSMK